MAKKTTTYYRTWQQLTREQQKLLRATIRSMSHYSSKELGDLLALTPTTVAAVLANLSRY